MPKITVAIVTYKRAWSLPYCLDSLTKQTRRPDEVLVVLKPSGDGSEEVIRKFSDELPIRLMVQREGNFTDAVAMAYRNAEGELILYIDDDAIAHPEFVERYEALFRKLDKAGGITGLGYTALMDGQLKLINETQRSTYTTIGRRRKFLASLSKLHRKPLPEYADYCEWLSTSGLLGGICSSDAALSAGLWGANMGLKTELIVDCPLDKLYKRSKRGFHNEQILSYCIRRKGYHTYRVLNPDIAPIVWHIQHRSLSRDPGFWGEFWIHYDRVANYWRLRELGARVSFAAYLFALIVLLRRKTLPRLLATLTFPFTGL
ncbi:MAG: glycosyltransferase family 2 protein [Thermoproteus sp.]|nr:glycosyltransferase family 2 protein [Thermoproteus sp.]